MKRIVMIFALLLGVTAFANAQQGGGNPEDRMKRMVETMSEKLKLTEDQKTKVSAIYADQWKAMQKAREEAGDDRSKMREAMMKQRKETEDKVQALLNDDQKKAYTAWREEQRANMQNRQQGGGNSN
ncbi:Spy/CpxP family protein refolding chaperone [Pedobacter sp. SYP-B3415]|uniref:Spy/CpxP family protein refolding chaperone n=1 Tax=Pedobacter sp. SYP-B3415 TaxID=2496641 RepID=UPI00101D7165|nr:periplasmic heavy metal sensor [Pedobacter sp. SYP-B3415]